MQRHSYMNAVYYPNWRIYKQIPPSSLQVQRITHIFYAFIGVNENGTLKHFDEWADLNIDVDGVKGCLAAVSQLKQQHPHLQVILSFGGGSGSAEFPAVAADRAARERFASSARAMVDRFGLDGIDIDWEHPDTPARGEDYVALLEACRIVLPAPRFTLTSALPCGEWALQHIPLGRAAGLLDRINVMAYDFAGPWTKVSGHHGQLRPPLTSPSGNNRRHNNNGGDVVMGSAIGGVSYFVTRGVAPSKLVLGIPVYARFFPGATGPSEPFYSGAAGEIDYCDLPATACLSARVDFDTGGAWFVDPDKGFHSLDVPATLRIKARFVKENHLAGLFYWTGAGDVHGSRSLIRAGYEELRSDASP